MYLQAAYRRSGSIEERPVQREEQADAVYGLHGTVSHLQLLKLPQSSPSTPRESVDSTLAQLLPALLSFYVQSAGMSHSQCTSKS